MTAAVRPFCIWGDSALDHVCRRAQEALDIWARSWLPGAEQTHLTVQVKALARGETPLARDYEGLRGALSTLWVRTRAPERRACGEAVMSSGLTPDGAPVDDWVAEVVERAWAARNHTLCKALFGAPELNAASAPQHDEFAGLAATGSGALQISCDALGLYALVDRSATRDMPPIDRGIAQRMPPLVSMDEAMRSALLSIEAQVGSVELSLEQVLDIRRGDVLRLPRRLDQPLTLSCAGQALAHARLGVHAGRKAVKALAHHDEK